MNELKPEDVMRALECCGVYYNCNGCPYFDGVPEDDCHYKAMANALALLREKDARIEQLLGDIRATVELANKGAAEKDAEIERLQNALAISKKETKRYVTSYRQTRAEAITEFAERLTGRFNACKSAMYSETTVHEVIARIAKEMKEGEK